MDQELKRKLLQGTAGIKMVKSGGYILSRASFISIILIITLLSQFPVYATQHEPIINGTGIFIATGESWDFYQGYKITIVSVNQGKGQAWVKVTLNDDPIHEKILNEGENINYSREYEILNLTLDTIYSNPGSDLVTFKPVYQYRDIKLPDPIFEEEESIPTNESDESTEDDNSKNIAGFELLTTSFAILLSSHYFRKNRDRK